MQRGINTEEFIKKHELTQALSAFGKWLEDRYQNKKYFFADIFLPHKISFYRRLAQLSGKEVSAKFYGSYKKNEINSFNPPVTTLLKNFIIFGRDWLKVLFVFFKYCFSNKTIDSKPLNVFKMHGLESLIGKDDFKKFINFCDETLITPFNDKTSCLICWGNFKQEKIIDRFVFTQDPFAFMSFDKLSVGEMFSFVFFHFYFAFIYLIQSLFKPDFLLLSKDFAWLSIWTTINNNKFLKNYMLENSAFDNQEIFIEELPSRNFETHMVFYSINHMGLKYTGVEGVSNSAQFKYMVADYGWVWNSIQQKWLQNHSGLRKMFNVTSIHFMPLPKKSVVENKAFRVAVFDTTPYVDEYLFKVLGWKGSFFHSESVMVQFLKDLSLLKKEIPDIQLILKTKRGFNKNHSEIYKKLCDDLYSNHIAEEYNHELDVIGLIDSSDLVISAPFTSPGFVASERGTESVFYTPGDIIEDNLNLNSENIHFINSFEQLLKFVQETMREK